MKRISLALVLFLLFGCSSPAKLGTNKGLPENSIAAFSPSLYDDAMKNITAWLKQNHGCSKFTVVHINSISQKGDVRMDDYGRLYTGSIAEEWLVDHCGKQSKLGVVFAPDGKGGNFIALSNIAQ